MIRMLAFLLLLGLLYKYGYPMLKAMNQCDHCEGEGYWIGTRGDKNHCAKCDGSGRRH